MEGLKTKVKGLEPPKDSTGGGSDDVGDISWNLPMVYLRFPANIPNLPGHSWPNAIAMATPIAHKGSTAGAKVQAMTALDYLLSPELIKQALVDMEERRRPTFVNFNDIRALLLRKMGGGSHSKPRSMGRKHM